MRNYELLQGNAEVGDVISYLIRRDGADWTREVERDIECAQKDAGDRRLTKHARSASIKLGAALLAERDQVQQIRLRGRF